MVKRKILVTDIKRKQIHEFNLLETHTDLVAARRKKRYYVKQYSKSKYKPMFRIKKGKKRVGLYINY